MDLRNLTEMQQTKPRPRIFYGWIVVFSSFIIFLTVSGTRGSFGNFVQPLSEQFGWSVKQVSLAASISTLFYGLGQPFIGFIVNRKGPRAAIIIGVACYGSLTIFLYFLTQLWVFYLVYGLLMGTAWGATANTPVTALISRWFTRRKGIALAIAISGMATGNFLLIPFSMFLILNIGWRYTFVVMGLLVLVVSLPQAFRFLRNSPEEKGLLPDGDLPLTGAAAVAHQAAQAKMVMMGLPQAIHTRSFWLMLFGYFTCGFSALMSSTFFVPMALHAGFPELASAQAAGFMGAASAIGLWLGGYVSDIWGRKRPLAALFFLRGVGFFLLLNVHNMPGLYLAALFIGFGAFGTAPLTAGLVGDIFGVVSMASIFGVISMAHQVGGAFSIYMAGIIVDATNSYQWAIIPAICLLMAASLGSLAIQEKRTSSKPNRS